MEKQTGVIVSDFLPPPSHDSGRHERRGQMVVNLGLAWNIVLAAGKTAMGIIGHSTALLSDGINSTSDVAYYIVVKIFMKLAGQPPDREHPYGHRQMESIAALTVGSFVITSAIAIFWTAINNFFDRWQGVAAAGGASLVRESSLGPAICQRVLFGCLWPKVMMKLSGSSLPCGVYAGRLPSSGVPRLLSVRAALCSCRSYLVPKFLPLR